MTQITAVAVTMTSLEMVEYINSQRGEGEAELQHKNFLAKVPEVLGEETSAKFLADLPDSYGRPRKGYKFPKREACLMAMSYSYELQAKVFDRMTALEHAPSIDGVSAPKLFPDYYHVARLIGLDNNVAAISANQAVFHKTGENVLALLGQTHLNSEHQTLFFTPTELGKRIDVTAIKMNGLLAEAGLQSKVGEKWIPLPLAEGLYRLFDTGKRHNSGTMVQQIKWSGAALDKISQAA